jgi:superfamily II DNA/RNA helicase
MADLADSFADLPEPIRDGIRSLGWTHPTPVQDKVLPAMRDGHDVIVQAHTGSGKTGAFGIPIAMAIDPELDYCQALVLAPTRELANQVAEETAALGAQKGVRSVPIYGGVWAPTWWWAPPAGSWTTWVRAGSPSTASRSWSSTRPTSCSRWASGPTCARS